MHLLQVLWKVAVVHRFAGHPLHGFIDLLFLANTSAIILDERHSGYYLHGRNQMHHSGALPCMPDGLRAFRIRLVYEMNSWC